MCGLTGRTDDFGWSFSKPLKESGTTITTEEGFAGPTEPAVMSMWGTIEVILFCTPTRILLKVKAKNSTVMVDGERRRRGVR